MVFGRYRSLRANVLLVGLLAGACLASGCGAADGSSSTLQGTDPPDGGTSDSQTSPDVPKGDQPVKSDAGTSSACSLGEAVCSSSGVLLLCDSAGAWLAAGCPAGCESTPTGGHCRFGAPTVVYEATVSYEARKANDLLTDWGPIFQRPARGLLAKSFQAGALVDVQMVDSQGRVRMRVPQPLADGDAITLWAVEPTSDGSRASIAVAEPSAPDGFAYSNQQVPSSQGLWHWDFDPSLSASPASLLITEQGGSGAVQVFDNVRRVHDAAVAIFGKPGPSLVVWLRLNTYWSCGSCYWNQPTTSEFSGQRWDAQLFVPASAADLEYWSDSMILHETGHWLVNGFGKDPAEGGPHYVGCPTFPGQAWAEAWPTWMSATLRNDPVYVVKLNGNMFWTDLETRQFSAGVPWPRPSATASEGVLQPVEENEVAAMLWALSKHTSNGDASNPLMDNKAMVRALASSRMTQAPFGRGYTRHTWETGAGCSVVAVQDTQQSVPCFADFLDALLCTEQLDPARVDAVTEPFDHFPYPAQATICQ
jgi:hypothetical protein